VGHSGGSNPEFPELQDETLWRMSRADNYNAWLVQRGAGRLGRRVLPSGPADGSTAVRTRRR